MIGAGDATGERGIEATVKNRRLFGAGVEDRRLTLRVQRPTCALANSTEADVGTDSETQKTPNLARAQRGRLQPSVRRQPSLVKQFVFNDLHIFVHVKHIGFVFGGSHADLKIRCIWCVIVKQN